MRMHDLDLLDCESIGADNVESDIAAGGRNIDALTDLEFHRRHPERSGKKIQKGETAAAREWTSIREDVVRPALLALARPATAPPAASTALVVRESAPVALVQTAEEDGGWTFWRVVTYGLGGLGALLLGAFVVRHRGSLALEARTATRHAGRLASRAGASLRGLGSEHRALRQNVAAERQGAMAALRMRKLQAELEAADQKVSEATRIAEQKARQIQALRNLRGNT